MTNAIVQYVKLEDVIPYANNPRKNDGDAVDKVAASIKEYGFNVPLVLDKDNVIITGHTRYKAANKLKLSEVPCIYANHLTPAQVKAYRIADNKVAEYSTWNDDLLSLEFEQLQELDFDFDLTGFEDIEIENYIQENESEHVTDVEDDYEVELPNEPKAKQGDIYKLGKHYLMCGDSTNISDVEKLVNNKEMNMLITDPPYNVDYEGVAGKIQNDSMSNEEFRKFLHNAFYAADKVMKNGATFYIWHADSEGYNFRGACEDVGWKIRQCLVWNKNTLVMGRQDYQWKHEPCLYGWKSGASHYWANDRKQTTVIDFDKPLRNVEHPTMKPVGLFDYQIRNNTKQGDMVLDLFAGSGTTLIACEQNGRISYNMELDPKYVDVIINRWETLTGEQAVLLNVETA